MKISFEYPVVYMHSDDLEDADITYHKGKILPMRFDQEPYEMILETNGNSFDLVFGSKWDGNFLCIPNWQFGCALSDLTDKQWNMESILKRYSEIDYEDATAICRSLSIASEMIKK